MKNDSFIDIESALVHSEIHIQIEHRYRSVCIVNNQPYFCDVNLNLGRDGSIEKKNTFQYIVVAKNLNIHNSSSADLNAFHVLPLQIKLCIRTRFRGRVLDENLLPYNDFSIKSEHFRTIFENSIRWLHMSCELHLINFHFNITTERTSKQKVDDTK